MPLFDLSQLEPPSDPVRSRLELQLERMKQAVRRADLTREESKEIADRSRAFLAMAATALSISISLVIVADVEPAARAAALVASFLALCAFAGQCVAARSIDGDRSLVTQFTALSDVSIGEMHPSGAYDRSARDAGIVADRNALRVLKMARSLQWQVVFFVLQVTAFATGIVGAGAIDACTA